MSWSIAITWFGDKIFYPLLSLLLPKVADHLMSRWFGKHLFIDDVITTTNDKTITFDIRVSNASDQAISLTHLYIKLFNPPVKGQIFRSTVQDSSATYEVFDKDGKFITSVGNEQFFDFSSMESKGNFIFQSKFLQKVNSKDTDRFKFVIHLAALNVNSNLNQVEAIVTYAFQGNNKTTQIIKDTYLKSF
ncbi:MAG: hypothetical protein IPH94_06560 [Saprospiraceae bacterium]|nr:hypothetical protein [Saprospiraceae bacterium]MBK8850912.1 hypothetical protein [Saprospiraceae bacterium]MBK9688180.1 hypothetical protein [Saprospiraceae bacterium]